MDVSYGTNVRCSTKLENLQYEAGRIITGLPIYTKKELIYSELSWQSLHDRRQHRTLSLFYNIQHDNAPTYLASLQPRTVSTFSNYNLRNKQNFQTPFHRLQITKASFIPSTSEAWNNLQEVTKSVESLRKLKKTSV